MFFAHVGGVPVEEALLPLVSGASAALLLLNVARSLKLWNAVHLSELVIAFNWPGVVPSNAASWFVT